MDNLHLSGRYYLPADALVRRRIESGLSRTFEARGYCEIIPTTLVGLGLEQLAPDGLGNSGGADSSRGPKAVGCTQHSRHDLEGECTSYVVLTRDGNLLTLCSDLTTPVAALAARHLLSADGPTRLYYSGTVFRAQKPGSGRPEERRQVGAELIGRGATGVQADAEILSMAAEGLINIGLRDFCIGLSDAKLLSAILDAAGAQGDTGERIRSALAARDYVLYGELVSSLDGAAVSVELLRRLPHLHARAEVLEALRTADVCEAGGGLVRTLDALDNRGLGRFFRLDLAITRRFRYYTGVVFEGYAPGCGNAVIGGGRYDNLLAYFGTSAPAAGFAVDVDSVASALGALDEPKESGGGAGQWGWRLWTNLASCEAVRSRH
jgi:ATP phosphoribosyltransferase regulatory subunit